MSVHVHRDHQQCDECCTPGVLSSSSSRSRTVVDVDRENANTSDDDEQHGTNTYADKHAAAFAYKCRYELYEESGRIDAMEAQE